MTTTLLETPAPDQHPTAAAPERAHLPFRQILSAEWIKIRTVRSTAWTLAGLVVVSVGLTALACMLAAGEIAAEGSREPVGPYVLWGLLFGQIAALVLGILAATSEYSSGMIRTTLAAVPRRGSVLAAKSVVLGSILLVVGFITALTSFVAGNFFFSREGIGLAFDDPGVLRAIVGGGLYFAVLGIFGVALGIVMRHTAGAVTVGIALIFVVGGLVGLIPGAIGEWLNKLMPGNAGSSVANVEMFDPNLLDPWVGFAVFCGETGLLLAVAALLFSRRDA
ncbi:ABC transporter permease subunit [Phytoactinopolyspora mesophila]|uniref:ABC transporter permease subunit n=1 Tax=Phytoactinopolyspora mesophila TaxID=2650750 RepID=A0A7K3M571_9ACTN|nr:ABC transporter permease subunit [Phytoactinopolyspora mesophila]NDL58370.1 ABC transporter permease subunit [Phytoactinopolyspora mesophila]